MVELVLLKCTEQLSLLRQRDFAHLIKKQRASVGQLEATYAVTVRAGERTLHVSEELALEQVLRNGRAVDFHKGLVGSVTASVDCARNHLLADS